MSSATVYNAVRAYLDANWASTPLSWENEAFTLPEPPSEFIAIEVYGDSTTQESIGSGDPSSERWVETGAVLAHILSPSGTGSLTARTHAENLTTLFKGLELPGAIRFRTMSIGLGETATEDGAWWRLSVRAEWLRG